MDVGEQEEHVRLELERHEHRQRVIVGEELAHLRLSDDVVFVDQRHAAMVEEPAQRAAEALLTRGGGEVGLGDEQLAHRHRVVREERVVQTHEGALTGGRTCAC